MVSVLAVGVHSLWPTGLGFLPARYNSGLNFLIDEKISDRFVNLFVNTKEGDRA